MPTPEEDAAWLDAATRNLVNAAGQHKAAGWPEEFNAARTRSVTSGVGGSNVAKTGTGTAASKIPPASGTKSTLPPASTKPPKSSSGSRL
jgi:hypothetical protein